MTIFSIISVTLDCYGIIISLILIWCLCHGTVGQKNLSRIFIWMCVFNMGTLLGDIPNWLCEGYGRRWYPTALWLGSFLLYICMFLLLMAYTWYVIEYLKPKVRVHRGFSYAVWAIGFVNLLCIGISQFNGMYYRIDSDNVYHRGDWYIIPQIFGVMILVIDTVIIFRYRRYLRKKEVLAFSGYIVLPLITVFIQYFFYGLSLTYTASTIALLVIFLDIQSEQAFLVEQMEKKLLQGRIAMLLSQIKPHFLYNSLIAIANLCTTDAQLARKETLDFACYLRGNMDSLSRQGTIPFVEELQHTKFYLSMERLRFEERLRVEYHIGPENFMIPPLTLQPMVENAIRHGVMQKEKGGTVVIGTEETEAEWLVTVNDDGVGFDTDDHSLYDERKHVGIYNVRQRLACLCGGSLELSSKIGEGTCVTIRLPKGGGEHEADSRR